MNCLVEDLAMQSSPKQAACQGSGILKDQITMNRVHDPDTGIMVGSGKGPQFCGSFDP